MHCVPDPANPADVLQVPLAEAADGPGESTADEAVEAEHFVRTLDANGQLSRTPGSLPPGATHQVVEQDGAKVVQRKRFSAF